MTEYGSCFNLSANLFVIVTDRCFPPVPVSYTHLKSGTTLETLTNEAFVKDALVKAGLNPSKHMLTATSETSPLAKSCLLYTSTVPEKP